MMNPVLQAALACADKGWPVFPCHPGRKLAATPNGYLDATTDRAQIREWFAGHPELNLAVATGAPGPDVLDLGRTGPEPDVWDTLWPLRQARLTDGAAAFIDPPSGGLHLYYQGTTRPSGHLPARDIRLIAQGGYVLVMPSQAGGEPYSGFYVPGKPPGTLDWDAVTRLFDPARTPRQPPAPETAAVRDRLSALARRVTHRQARPEPQDREAGA